MKTNPLRIALFIGVLLLAMGSFVFLNDPENESPVGFTTQVVTPPVVEEPSPSHETTNNRAATRKPFNPAQRPLSSKEKIEVEEIEAVTDTMTRLLDEGDDLLALEEARNLRLHPNRDVRLEAFLAMDWIGLPAAMDLAGMIDDEDAEIREAARNSFWGILNELNNPTLQRDLLSTALLSSDPEVRASALDELINIPDELSFELLAKTMLDTDEDVAGLARENAEFVSGETLESYEDAMRWFEANTPMAGSEPSDPNP